jgi:hypothetical protein
MERFCFTKPGFFDLTFESLIDADEASLNAKREERLERHPSSASRRFNANHPIAYLIAETSE